MTVDQPWTFTKKFTEIFEKKRGKIGLLLRLFTGPYKILVLKYSA